MVACKIKKRIIIYCFTYKLKPRQELNGSSSVLFFGFIFYVIFFRKNVLPNFVKNYNYKLIYLCEIEKPMQKLILIFILFRSYSILLAQDYPIVDHYKSDINVAYGNVPVSDMRSKSYEFAPDAEAIVLAKTGRMVIGYDYRVNYFDGMYLSYNFFKRIKLLKTSSFDNYNTVQVEFDADKYIEQLYEIKAMVIQSNGNCYTLKKEDFKEVIVSKNIKAIKFTFPSLTEGCIVQYEYTLLSRDLSSKRNWVFQEETPVQYSEIKLSIPAYYRYYSSFKGDVIIKSDSLPDERLVDYIGETKNEQVGIFKRKFYTQLLPSKKINQTFQVDSDFPSQMAFKLKEYNKYDRKYYFIKPLNRN